MCCLLWLDSAVECFPKGPSQTALRLTVDLAHLERSGWILAGGISGHAQDPQNSDQLGRWAPNDQVPLPDGANTAAHTLALAPA